MVARNRLDCIVDFEFHQALFGYEGGHQLLESSAKLPTDVSHLLSVATDISGSAPRQGFDYSYTGITLLEAGIYVLFCTWLAPEMRRPGCVWSHALLIDLADLARIPDLGILREFFVRPGPKTKLKTYSKRIGMNQPRYESSSRSKFSAATTRATLAALYAFPEKPVVIAAEDTKSHEDLIFAIWSQQFPRLRRSFNFSTGSFSSRSRGKRVFDLQVAPLHNISSWQKDDCTMILPGAIESSPLESQDWVKLAESDLPHAGDTQFRSFLRIFGADVAQPRLSFRFLAYVFLGLSDANTSWKDLLQAISRTYPTSDGGGTLKAAVVGPGKLLGRADEENRLVQTIDYLCREDATGFEAVPGNFKQIVSTLWKTRRDDLVGILCTPPKSEARWRELLHAVATHIPEGDLAWLWNKHPELLLPIVQERPNLAMFPELWKLPERAQWIVFDQIESRIDEKSWQPVAKAMLQAGTHVAIREVAERAGSQALFAVAEWLVEKEGDFGVPPAWTDVLRPSAQSALRRSEKLPVNVFALSASLVSPSLAAAIPASRPELRQIVKQSLEILPSSLRLPTAFLMTAIGLREPSAEGADVLACGFSPTYAALEGQSEPHTAWRILQPQLPVLWPWDEWDRCLKMRLGLGRYVEKFPDAKPVLRKAAKSFPQNEVLEILN